MVCIPIGIGFLDGRLAFDGMSITVEVHEEPPVHTVTVENP